MHSATIWKSATAILKAYLAKNSELEYARKKVEALRKYDKKVKAQRKFEKLKIDGKSWEARSPRELN